jgi:hypothetical protein
MREGHSSSPSSRSISAYNARAMPRLSTPPVESWIIRRDHDLLVMPMAHAASIGAN